MRKQAHFRCSPASGLARTPANTPPSVWELARQSKRALYGPGFLALGLLLLSFIGNDFLHSRKYDDSMRFLTGESVLLLLLGVGVLTWGINQVRGWQRLYTCGRVIPATVKKVKLARMQPYGGWHELYIKQPRRNAAYIVHYEYQDPSGALHRGRTGYLSDLGLKPGDLVRIRYDPEHPARSMWAGLAGDGNPAKAT